MTFGIYLPTYRRPQRLEKVVNNLKEATKNPYSLYFGVEREDTETIQELERLKQAYFINKYNQCFSDALQTIYEKTTEPIFFWANDDFFFLDGWDEAPLKMMSDEGIGVLGVHDGHPHTRFSTISFVRRKYIEEQSGVVDMPNRVLYPYKHNYTDDELTLTAQKRGAWDRCTEPCIRHLHHSFNFDDSLPVDETYRKNDETFAEDSATFLSRKHLFS